MYWCVREATECVGARHSGESSRSATIGGRLSAPLRQESKLAAGKVQIATEIVNLAERPIGGARPRPRLGLRQRSESVAELGQQPVARGAADQGAQVVPLGTAVGKRAAIGVERFLPPPGVKLEITERESEVRPVLRIGCDCEPTPRERRRLVLPEERLLLFRGGEIGPRRLSIVREVEMLGSQRRLVEEDAGRELVQLSPPRTGQRRIDPVAHECMHELEPIGRALKSALRKSASPS